VEPLAVLVVLPIAIGIVSELVFRDTAHASLAAAIGTTVVVFVLLRLLAPAGLWNWLAVLLISPLAIASALAAVLILYGRTQARRRRRRHDA
jgi:Na+-driven multidrug efflux pump